MNQSEISVQIQNLSKVYRLYNKHIDRLKEAIHPFKKRYHRPFNALKNINLEIKKGEIIGIIGRNGAGKSTLVKIISGIITQSQGRCRVNGKISSLIGLSSGFNPELTGVENIYLNGTIKGFSKKEMDERIEDIISFSEIGEFVNQPVKNYSSGMQARLSFAVAIHIDPEILILDEVLAVGDDLFRRKCHAKMENFLKAGCTVIYVSHSISSINEICTRAIFLDKGELILEGPPKLVTTYYQKFLFTNPKNTKKVREEIIRLNMDSSKKENFTQEIINKEMDIAETSDISEPTVETKLPIQSMAFYLPEFKPTSTITTMNFPVHITDIKITTPSGRMVNALVMNENYIYSVKTKFESLTQNVVFSMAIKNERGYVITSSRSGIGETGFGKIINQVNKGDEYLVNWKFKCRLFPGNYYTNIGIRHFPKGKESEILKRIVDALVFKVQDIPKLMMGGCTHMDQTVEISKITK